MPPFVIDWMLDSNFPHSPPIAHFLSWTNGNGRVNPNLYEEGKVCLSILGTWTGDKNEIWSATRSSLLQAFVSIQGLVLVKEPWFCEPAYEKLRGTEEGTVNSRLYSEKAYVLSRGFVRRALEIPLGGLESEIAQLFYTKKRLYKVVQDAQKLIQKSRDGLEISLEDQDIAVPRLTAGGIIALERTLKRLCSFLDRCPT
jgi:ubiquitin-conjugating enzyme E2 O